jgi:plasmid stabilization system protein ParE
MKRLVSFHRDAETELNDAADYYSLRGAGIGRRFIAGVEGAVSEVVEFPEASAPVYERVRRKVLSGYPYTVIYSVTGSSIRVLAVAHDKRRPFYWHGRV